MWPVCSGVDLFVVCVIVFVLSFLFLLLRRDSTLVASSGERLMLVKVLHGNSNTMSWPAAAVGAAETEPPSGPFSFFCVQLTLTGSAMCRWCNPSALDARAPLSLVEEGTEGRRS